MISYNKFDSYNFKKTVFKGKMNVVKNSNKIEIKNKPVIDIIITIIIPSRNITTTANQINSNSEKKTFI